MFQTEPILWLQAQGSPALGWLLSAVSVVGSTATYAVVLLALALCRRLRPSLAALAALLLAVGGYEAAKVGLALPRPDGIDTRVKSVGDPPAVVERGGAPRFWALPRPEAIAAARARHRDSYGFPSGHVAAATAFCLGVARFFRSRKALALAAVWVPAVALSRMYLGRHFLADVLGGLALGALAVLCAERLAGALATAASASRAPE